MLRWFISTILVATGIFASSLAFVPASTAIDIPCQSENADQCNLVKSSGKLSDKIWPIVSFVLGILAGIAVIIIIIGGIMYVTSGGDASNLTKAKNTILYAVIGLIVAILSSAIIAFVNGFFV